MNIATRMKLYAATPSFNLVDDSEVQRALRVTNNENLLNDDQYKRVFQQKHSNLGPQGGYGYQVAGVGIEHPMIYFAEIHEFENIETHERMCAIISYQVNEDTDAIKQDTVDVVIVNGNRFKAMQFIKNNAVFTRADGVNVIFRQTSLNEAQTMAKDAVKRYKQNIDLEDLT